MKPAEHHIDVNASDFVIRTPSAIARRTFLYLLRAGEFVYEPHYRLRRSTFDSFLLMLVLEGSMDLTLSHCSWHVNQDQFAIVDCYAPHEYGTDEPTKVLWIHFDGIMARPYYEFIVGKLGNVIDLRNPSHAMSRLRLIDDLATSGSGFSEARMSKYIIDLLTEFADEQESGAPSRQSQTVEDIVAYIGTHLAEPLNVGELAERAYLSEYHFIRVFKRETGLTPYAYIVDARLHLAKYLLVNGSQPLAKICEQCGFSSTSVFCASFKRETGMSPMEFRISNQRH